MKQFEVTMAGFGGQGIMTAGQLLAYSGMNEGKKVVWLPSYGPEMRGGTAYCSVVISDIRIGSPIINSPVCICVFNRPSFDKFESRVKSGGLFIVNSSLINVSSKRDDIVELLIPGNDLALKAGNPKATNIVIVGALIGATDIIKLSTVEDTLKEKLGHKTQFIKSNVQLLNDGYNYARKLIGKKVKA
jgi:2-oxoglutarate ferredoxin oxidoreductase subunit gamma